MATGKDPQTADGLGGVHNVTQPRAPVPDYPAAAPPKAAAPGPIPAVDSAMVEDSDQVGKVFHAQPVAQAAPFNGRAAADEASAWAAEKERERD
jgi:hypothetical protein